MATEQKKALSKELLLIAAGLLLYGLWCIKDGWFPSPSVLQRHPPGAELSFSVPGRVEKVFAVVGAQVPKDTSLAKLDMTSLNQEIVRAEQEVEDWNGKVEAQSNEVQQARAAARPEADLAALGTRLRSTEEARGRAVTRLNQLQADGLKYALLAGFNGTVTDVRIKENDQVQAGQVAVVLRSEDSFYLFNKSFAVLCLLGSAFFAFKYFRE